ncbi:MAG: MmcQ/YjbR family DNA-binding protein [Gemmataceae bacterium]|nr:MmcQ/YjbR family DNA-binding protein [Gemmataceae bacterium]
MAKANDLKKAQAVLREHALAFPETTEDFPWGHMAIKVKGKGFVFTYLHEGTLSVSVKLPVSGAMALQLAFASRTGYGLGKSGWVTARFAEGDAVPVDMLCDWLDESYRAIAPKRVLAQLEADESVVAKPPARKGKKRTTE